MKTRDACVDLDRRDPLGPLRARLTLPAAKIYLDGHSLGALPKATVRRVSEVVEDEWGGHLVAAWTEDGWIELPEQVGDRIAGLVGAGPGEVIVADSTSVNLFKLLVAACRLRPDRRVIVGEQGTFPTDGYIAASVADLLGCELRLVSSADVAAALDDRVATVVLSHVDFRSGRMHDMAEVCAAARRAGALTVWDLSHSVGAVPVALGASGADLAVGCGYKYLHGGPGAPAFAWAPRRLHEELENPLSGWLGHADPFAMEPAYRPAEGIRRLACGTPPIVSLAALEVAVELVAEAGIDALRTKSVALSTLATELVDELCGGAIGVVSPRDPAQRGSQISLRHPDGYPIVRALAERGVLADYREPEIIRFGLAPLSTRFADVYDAVAALADLLASREWDRPELRQRERVT